MTKKFSEVQLEIRKAHQRTYIHNYYFSTKKATQQQFNKKNLYDTTKDNTSLSQNFFVDYLLLPKKMLTMAGHAPVQIQLNQIKKNSNKEIGQKNIDDIYQLPANGTPSSQKLRVHCEKNSSHKSIPYSHSVLTKSSHNSSQPQNVETITNDFSTTVFKHTEHTWCIAIAPVHLRGLDAIGKIFGKSRGTVKSWCKEGAPIAYDGTSYCSEYNALFAWYLNHYQSYDEVNS